MGCPGCVAICWPPLSALQGANTGQRRAEIVNYYYDYLINLMNSSLFIIITDGISIIIVVVIIII